MSSRWLSIGIASHIIPICYNRSGGLTMTRKLPNLFLAFATLLVLRCAAESSASLTPPTAASGRAEASTKIFGSEFWNHWGDGNAEIASYELEIYRYNAVRKGTAVLIFVTEPTTVSTLIKSDQPSGPGVMQAMKLNAVRDFPTGIYDYNIMTSTFVALQKLGHLTTGDVAKVSFTAQEWCGHVYQHLLFKPAAIEQELHSYFGSEGDRKNTLARTGSIGSEDALLLWARGLAAPFLENGASAEAQMIDSLLVARFRHRPAAIRKASYAFRTRQETITVPGGTFDTDVSTVSIAGDRTWTIFTERSAPYRVIRWSRPEGESASLIKSARLPYWKLNGPGGEKELAQIGLTPRPSRTP